MKDKLLKVLERFAEKRIAVVGDLMLDKYIWGEVSRISPEAPVQVVNAVRETYEPGGAANVANNVAALNGKVQMIGIVGNDYARSMLLDKLRVKKIDVEGIITETDTPTTQKIRVMGRNQQLLRIDYENQKHIHEDIQSRMIAFLEKNIKEIDGIVISDYAKGVITPGLCTALIKMAKDHKKVIIVDPKPKQKKLYANVDLITPNNAEANLMTGMEDGSDETVIRMGSQIMKELNTNVLITRGEKGMSLFDKKGTVTHIPTKAKEVYSIIGAGDTVVATMALALSSGADLKEAAILANVAAGIKVGKVGTSSVSVEEMKKEIEAL